VLAVYLRALLSFQRRRGKQAGIAAGRAGSASVIQRFGSGLRLNCPRCGGRMKLIATITSPPAMRAILDHLRLQSDPTPPHPARPPPSDPATCAGELWH